MPGCDFSDDENPEKAQKQPYVYLNLSAGWDFRSDFLKKKELILYQKKAYQMFTGSIISLNFSDSVFISDLKFSFPASVASKRHLEYKIYINNQYAGKYNHKHRINLSCYISSLRIIVLGTGCEKSIKAWDENHYYTLTRDSSEFGISGTQLFIGLDSTFQKGIKAVNLNHMTGKNKRLPILKENKKPEKPFIFEMLDRDDKKGYQQFLDIDSNGNISLVQIKTRGNSKGINAELFCDGVIVMNKHEQNAQLSGKELYIRYKTDVQRITNYTESIKLTKNIWSASSFIGPVFIDLPDQAMVDIENVDPSFRVDIPYASENNVIGEKMYDCNKCFLRYKVVKALIVVKSLLSKSAYGIKILDCYRPFDVQKILYNKFPVKGYVADTIGGSIHNRGTAVDLSLTDLTGNDLEMGSEYDEFSIRSHISYNQLPDSVYNRRQFLRKTMLENHFVPIRMEWWHFEFDEARKFPKLNDPFPCLAEW